MRLANRIEPEDLQIVATQLFVEMLKSGYTSVAEFHYLHRPSGAALPNGTAQNSGANPLWDAIDGAARVAGIGLTFLPTLYQSSDFGGQPLKPEQARFFLDTDEFLRAVEARIGAARGAGEAAADRRCFSQPARAFRSITCAAPSRFAALTRTCRCTSMSRSRWWKCRPAAQPADGRSSCCWTRGC